MPSINAERQVARADHLPQAAPEPSTDSLRQALGIERLRPGQRAVIDSILHHRDTLAIMPAGAGKSLCYQLAALKMPGMTVVVSPLIALMKDQAERLEDAGMDATEVNSSLNTREENAALERIAQGNSEFVFTTPERLTDPDFIELLQRDHVSLFVIDEAHCISHWGHDFRPAYLQLGAVIHALGNPTVLALTATATDAVIEDIGRQLARPDMHVINTGIYRPHLHYGVVTVTDEAEKFAELVRLLHTLDGSGIIYAATVKVVEELYRQLDDSGLDVTCYHGQLAARMRARNQEAFMRGRHRIMIATNAFGMGIDKPDIRFVIHYQIPASLEAYYQESGRAGRDRADAECILLYLARDKQVQQFFLARHYPATDELNAIHAAFRKLAGQCPALSFARLHAELKALPASRLQIGLKLLKDAELISQDDNLDYHLSAQPVKPDALTRLLEDYHDKNARDRAALEHMVFYAQTGFCRWKVMLEYFGEQVDWSHCGTCDNCLHPPEQELSPLHDGRTAPDAGHEERDALAVGDRVSLTRYGEGMIAAVAGDKVTVDFPDSRSRTFLRDYVKRI